MRDLLMVCPTKGRPDNVDRLVAAWVETQAAADLLLVHHHGDQVADSTHWIGTANARTVTSPVAGMVASLNWAAVLYGQDYPAVGFLGDDHMPRTVHWDRMLGDAVRAGHAVAYPNDLYQGPNLPTAVVLDQRLVAALGYMAPPALRHMFADDFWLHLGQGLNSLAYLPGCVVEHLHPHAGKAPDDPGYHDVWPLLEADRQAWTGYCAAGGLADDVARCRRALDQAWRRPDGGL